jgi:transposase, IS5 family
MRPQKPTHNRQQDLFRSRLDQIINLNHPLSQLTNLVNWDHLYKEFIP